MSDDCTCCIAKDAMIAQLGADLAIARERARHYEFECHRLRAEVNALRQDAARQPTTKILRTK